MDWGWWCGGGSWAGIVEESWVESEALGNVRVQGQDCRVSTCSPLGPTAQAFINPLSGAVACHYSLIYIHTQVHTLPIQTGICI